MNYQKDKNEIFIIKKSCKLVSQTLGILASEIKPGINTLYLDKIAESYIRDNLAIPAFLGLYNFPNTICVSINDQVVHGIPNNKYLLREGDIISIDCGVLMNGYYGDSAYTFEVGEVKNEVKKLLDITKKSLYLGISFCKIGYKIGDIGHSIQTYVEKNGYNIVREFVGHGLGKKIHEDPKIPNYGFKGHGENINEGMVLAIEPMVNQGSSKIIFDNDGWTIRTADKKLSAHFEHTIAVVKGNPLLLSTYKYIYKALNISFDEKSLF